MDVYISINHSTFVYYDDGNLAIYNMMMAILLTILYVIADLFVDYSTFFCWPEIHHVFDPRLHITLGCVLCRGSRFYIWMCCIGWTLPQRVAFPCVDQFTLLLSVSIGVWPGCLGRICNRNLIVLPP